MKPHTPTDKGINMKPQETVKDRARQAYLDQQTQDSEGGCGQPIGFIYGFIAGEDSGERITLERLAAKADINFHKWYDDGFKNEQFLSAKKAHDNYYKYLAEVCIEREKSFFAKIELQDQRIKTLESALVDISSSLRVHASHGSAIARDTLSYHQKLLSEIQKDGK